MNNSMGETSTGAFSPEEEAKINLVYDALMKSYMSSNHRRKVEKIAHAYRFARAAHKGGRRNDGSPYILHPLSVALICSRELGLGSTTIVCALLHDIVQHSDMTIDDIYANFGLQVASIVEGINKLSGGIFGHAVETQALKLRDMMMSMSTDVRVILVKMADRLHNLRNIRTQRESRRHRVARESLYVYAPLAERLGLFALKSEFENLAFRTENPTAFDMICRKLEQTETRRSKKMRDFIAPLKRKLDEEGFVYEIKGRVKSAYSIFRKMTKKNIPFEEIYDIYAIRIIFENDDDSKEEEMARKIGRILANDFTIHPDRTRDWLHTPKDNGYRALHLTLKGKDGVWTEVQIRSRKMDDIAELGYAAHWKYKDGVHTDTENLDKLVNEVKEILADPEPDAIDFLDTLRFNILAKQIYVFTAAGDLIGLPTGATVLDLAYAIDDDTGNHCIGGKINRRLFNPDHVLESGDLVEIITVRCAAPDEKWLAWCVTAHARNIIKTRLAESPAGAPHPESPDPRLQDNFNSKPE
ncbi:MAG: HD domain-containing protein [Bacteroidales bacterium]|nr:HD domain-containing protein [Bacteroidales bacterium]